MNTRQRGVALITAVLIVALATMLAVAVGFRGFLDQRRTATTFALDQAFQVALGGEAWAADALKRDSQQNSKIDDFTEEWATPIPPVPIDAGNGGPPIGEFEGQLDDMQGRFNLNNLVVEQGGQLVVNQEAVELFKALLGTLDLEEKWATLIADWIDTDSQETFPDGAEDFAYTSLTPPYRTANMPITRTSELLALQDFGIERFQKLEPFIAALPIGTKINLCTASFELLDVLSGATQFTQARESNLQIRAQRCFPDQKAFENSITLPQKQREAVMKLVQETSSYFRASIWVTMGSTDFTMYSLLMRTGGPQAAVRPILRSSGTY